MFYLFIYCFTYTLSHGLRIPFYQRYRRRMHFYLLWLNIFQNFKTTFPVRFWNSEIIYPLFRSVCYWTIKSLRLFVCCVVADVSNKHFNSIHKDLIILVLFRSFLIRCYQKRFYEQWVRLYYALYTWLLDNCKELVKLRFGGLISYFAGDLRVRRFA